MFDVFLISSLKDKEKTEDIKKQLQDAGLSVWMADEKLINGESFENTADATVSISRAFVLAYSKDCQDSYSVKKQLDILNTRGKKLFIFKLDDSLSEGLYSNSETVDNMENLISRIKESEYRSGINIFNFLSYPPEETAKAIKHFFRRYKDGINKNPLVSIKASLCTLLVLICLGFVFSYMNSHISVDIGKCISLKTYGIEDYGRIGGEIDFSNLSSRVQKKLNEKGIYEYDFSLDFSESDFLSNGDSVVITVIYNGDASQSGIKFVNDTISKEINNLPEGTVIDPFEHVHVSYEGTDGRGRAYMEIDKNDFDFEYVMYKNENLSVGDEVTVYVNCDEKELNENGYGLTVFNKTYVVDALDEMIVTPDQLSNSFIDRLSIELTDMIIDKARSEFSSSYGEKELKSAYTGTDEAVYLIKLKDDRYDTNINGVIFLKPLNVEISTFYGMGRTVKSQFYVRSAVYNVALTPEKDYSYDTLLSEIKYYDDYDTYMNCVEGLYGDKYDIMKVK